MPTLILMWLKRLLMKKLGGYLMRKFLINWLLPTIYDALIKALIALSKKSDSKVDDIAVEAIASNREEILEELKKNLS